MRKLPILVVLLLASLLLLAAAASAHAVTLPSVAAGPPVVALGGEGEVDDQGEDESDPAEEADDESETCEVDDEEVCREIEAEEEAEECVLEDADASFTAAPGAGQIRLRVHYRTYEPAQVVVDARLRGTKGALRLGTDRARFNRAGVYRYSFDLGGKQLAKAVAAKDLEVDLYAVGTPANCEMHLAAHHGSARGKL